MKNFSNFVFHFPTEIVFGKDTELQTADLIKKYGGTKVMIVMDGGGFIKKNGLFDKVVATLNTAGIPFVELEGVQPNPRLSLVYKGLELVKKENVDFLLAIGGGSTIDTSKAIAAGMGYDGDVWDFYCGKAVPQKFAKLGVISTIAATGSETSGGSVILDDIKSHTKYSFKLNHTRATFAIMNPELTYTLPPFQTGAGSVDILAHAFDTYFTFGDSYLGDRFCEATMCAAVKYGPIALKDPTNYEARAELMLTSSFSHNDTCRIGRSAPAGGGHNLERHLSGSFDTAHGAGLAVMMPAWLQYMLDHDETTIPKIAQFANRVFNVEADPLNPKEVGQEGINRFRAWIKELGMPLTLHDLVRREVTDAEIDDLTQQVRYNPQGMMAGFGHCTKEDIRNLFLSVR